MNKLAAAIAPPVPPVAASSFIDSNGDTHPIDAISSATVHAIAPQEPQLGGRYTRDPATGALTLVFRTAPALPRQRPAPVTEQPSKE